MKIIVDIENAIEQEAREVARRILAPIEYEAQQKLDKHLGAVSDKFAKDIAEMVKLRLRKKGVTE